MITVSGSGLAAAGQVGPRLRRAAATLHEALPADQAADLVQDETRPLLRTARHGLTRSMRVSLTGRQSLPLEITATAAAGLGTSAEHGSTKREQVTTYTRRGHKVRRRTRRQLPPPSREGYVIGPAIKKATPRITQEWADAAADHIETTLGG